MAKRRFEICPIPDYEHPDAEFTGEKRDGHLKYTAAAATLLLLPCFVVKNHLSV